MTSQKKALQQATPQQVFKTDWVRKKFEKVLGDRAGGFVTSVLQVINQNKMLQNADPVSVMNAAMTAASLNLPVNPNLGFAYIIPYNLKGRGVMAQFQMGYKGFIQLCMRSGQFKTISAAPIYEGQLIEENPLTGFRFNFGVMSDGEPVGYAAYFELLNGFQKTFYMSREDIEAHAVKYSQSYKGRGHAKSSGPWVDTFDKMAIKTVLKLLLSTYGPMSVDMLDKALAADQGLIQDEEGMEIEYPDNPEENIPDQPDSHERESMEVDAPQDNVEDRDSLFNEVMDLGKTVHKGQWYPESKILASNISDGEAGNMKELDEDGLQQARKILESKLEQVEG